MAGKRELIADGVTNKSLWLMANSTDKRRISAESSPVIRQAWSTTYERRPTRVALAAHTRQFGHTAMRTASKCSSGTGRLSSFKAAT